MNTEEYLTKRINDLEKAVLDSSLPMRVRKNQALALINYRNELEREIAKSNQSAE